VLLNGGPGYDQNENVSFDIRTSQGKLHQSQSHMREADAGLLQRARRAQLGGDGDRSLPTHAEAEALLRPQQGGAACRTVARHNTG
jgi:hypothetical protein